MFFGVYGVYGMLRCGFPHIKMTHLWRIYEHTAALRDRRAASGLVVLALPSGPARRKGNPTGCCCCSCCCCWGVIPFPWLHFAYRMHYSCIAWATHYSYATWTSAVRDLVAIIITHALSRAIEWVAHAGYGGRVAEGDTGTSLSYYYLPIARALVHVSFAFVS